MISSNFKIEDRMINMAEKYITMIQGDTLSFGIEVSDQNGEPLNVNDVIFVARKDYNSETSIFNISLGDGITHEGDGMYMVRVAPEDTINVEAGRYYYGLRTRKSGDVFTVMYGILEIVPRVIG